MRYSIEPKDRIHVKGCRLLSFAKNMGTQLSREYGQKLLDSAKQISNRCNKNYFEKTNPKSSSSNWRFDW